MQDEETKAWLALALCAQGRPDVWLSVARACGGALAAIGASDQRLAGLGASAAAVAALRQAWSRRSARVLERCARLGISVAAPGAAAYPPLLWSIPDPPLVVFWRGAEPASCAPGLAVVGARRCTEYGERTAFRIAREVAALGVVVVSGLARGIDSIAHRGALETGRTVAVLAGGLDRVYPGEHCSLAERIVATGGCLASEQPPGVRPLPWLFPFRNRIITGLCLATVVVEAGVRSGSLASARHCLDQGREVFVVPGPIDSPASQGSNGLLTQGATPFCRTSDLEAVTGLSNLIEKGSSKSARQLEFRLETLPPEQALLVAAIRAGAATPDEIGAATALDGTRVLALLTALELDGLIRREAHGRFRTALPRH